MSRRERYRFPFPAYPAVRVALLLIAGITLSQFRIFDMSMLLLIAAPILILWATAEWGVYKSQRVLFSSISMVCYLLLILLSGAILSEVRYEALEIRLESATPLELYAWENLTISATIDASGSTQSGRAIFLADVSETALLEGEIWRQNYRLRLYSDIDGELQYGDQIKAKIRLYPFPERRNPHEFDYGLWLKRSGIAGHGEIVSLISLSKPDGNRGWGDIRERVQSHIDELFDPERAPMAKALFLGHKEDLDPELRTSFSRSGLSHVMAVSGLHVGFVVAPFWLIIPLFWQYRFGKIAGITILTLLLVGYAGLTGFTPSVCRASLMAWFLTCAKLFHKARNSINLTAAAATILLLINPHQLFEVGFQLSFGAVISIFLVMPQFQRWMMNRGKNRLLTALVSVILISVVVQAGLYPILINRFGEFSIIGPLANALVVPLLSLAVPVGLAVTLITMTGFSFLKSILIPVEWILFWIEWVAGSMGGMSGSYITAGATGFGIYFVWLSVLMLISTIRIPALRWKWVICLLLFSNLWMMESWLNRERSATLTVTVLDVGQGDAIHVETPNGKHLLIDAGRWSPMGNSGDRVLIPYFRSIGVEEIDAVFLSHPHADHIGGMPDILRELKVQKIFQSDYEYDSRIYREMMTLTDQKNVPVITPFAGDLINMDPSIRIFVIGPERGALRPSNPNDHSLALKVVYGKSSILLTGDAENAQELAMARRYGDFLSSDIYKVGHHGSNTSSGAALLQYVNPQYSVASLALRNRFGHPGRNAVDNIYQFSNQKLYTSLEGAVRFESDGKRFRRVDW
ncbi:MAG: DNA internalization-related competence protein ComEC/Rec2 [Balneolaceae bacterium]|nr:DNA internalization-related competence protein ComEC/Rec2 [Balneolaceae bacterium]MCH8548320.1 DNA internalization-related competence protein ComEC/Rec2 [Balneolaceae bacterium]